MYPRGAAGEALIMVPIGLLRIATYSGKPAADANKLLANLEDEAKADGNSPTAQSYLAHAKGLMAWSAKCDAANTACRFDLATAQRKSGDDVS